MDVSQLNILKYLKLMCSYEYIYVGRKNVKSIIHEIEHTSGLTTIHDIPRLSLRQLLGQLSLQFHDLRLLRGHG